MFGVRGRFQSFQWGLLRGCLIVSLASGWRGSRDKDVRPETQHGATEVCSDIIDWIVMIDKWLSTSTGELQDRSIVGVVDR
jgi:hypothetical protein